MQQPLALTPLWSSPFETEYGREPLGVTDEQVIDEQGRAQLPTPSSGTLRPWVSDAALALPPLQVAPGATEAVWTAERRSVVTATVVDLDGKPVSRFRAGGEVHQRGALRMSLAEFARRMAIEADGLMTLEAPLPRDRAVAADDWNLGRVALEPAKTWQALLVDLDARPWRNHEVCIVDEVRGGAAVVLKPQRSCNSTADAARGARDDGDLLCDGNHGCSTLTPTGPRAGADARRRHSRRRANRTGGRVSTPGIEWSRSAVFEIDAPRITRLRTCIGGCARHSLRMDHGSSPRRWAGRRRDVMDHGNDHHRDRS